MFTYPFLSQTASEDYHLVCSFCGGDALTALPYFSAGQGNAFRTLEVETLCSRCGQIALPNLLPKSEAVPTPQNSNV